MKRPTEAARRGDDDHNGWFVVIEGPSGVGKSTVAELLRTELARRELPVTVTAEPSDSALGKLARQGADEYRGVVLACLVAADRYYHLERDIRPALRAGYVVICERYLPTSLVLQRIDGVESSFLRQLNQYADDPDLTVILTGGPAGAEQRLPDRGIYSRVHRGGPTARAAEDRLYRDMAHTLRQAGHVVLHIEVAGPVETVARVVLDALLGRMGRRT